MQSLLCKEASPADNQGAAERWIGRILEHADLAAEAPLLGRIVPELGRADIRETYLRSYRIVYRTDGHSPACEKGEAHACREESASDPDSNSGAPLLAPKSVEVVEQGKASRPWTRLSSVAPSMRVR
jgi:plasmid stabilization system protein ParE